MSTKNTQSHEVSPISACRCAPKLSNGRWCTVAPAARASSGARLRLPPSSTTSSSAHVSPRRHAATCCSSPCISRAAETVGLLKPPTGPLDSPAEVHLLGIHEEALIEQADLVERRPPDSNACAERVVDLERPLVPVARVAPIQPRVGQPVVDREEVEERHRQRRE